MHCIGLDPGPEKSATCLWNGVSVEIARIATNEEILDDLRRYGRDTYPMVPLVIEQIVSYGMTVGAEVFETCVWTGRFIQAYEEACGPSSTFRIKRGDIKLHLCHTMRAKDANVRQAILDRFGGKAKAIGRKATHGPLWGISSHLWSALAVALVYTDQKENL